MFAVEQRLYPRMAAPILTAGSVIRVSGTGPLSGRDRAHLFIIAHVKANGDALIVPVCSLKAYSDRTLIFRPDRTRIPIVHDSFADFHQTKGVSLIGYQNKVVSGEIEFIIQLFGPELNDVISGLRASEETPMYAVNWLDA
jgi:hypothetical protein